MATTHFSGPVASAAGFSAGSGGTTISFIKKGTIAINPPSITTNAAAVVTLTITGAATGDTVVLTPGTAGFTAGICLCSPWVSAADTVKVTVLNITGGTLDESSLTCQYALIRS